MAIRKSLTILEEIDKLTIEAKALHVVAEKEKRELSDDEFARFSAITEEGNGELAVLDAELIKAKKYEAAQLDIANRIAHPAKPAGTDGAVLRPVTDGAGPKVALPSLVYHNDLKGFSGPDARETAYKCGAHMAACLFGNAKGRQICNDLGLNVQAKMTEGSNTAGGFLVLPEFEQAVIDLRKEYGVFGKFAKRRNMASDSVVIPRRKSGLTAYALGENVEITASDKSFSQVEVVAKKWGVLTLYSSELSEDSFIDLGADLAEEISYAISVKEDNSGFIGDGSSTYHGITGAAVKIDDGTHTASVVGAASGNDDFAELDYADFSATVAKLPNFPGLKPAWHCSRVGFYESMDRLAQAAGGNTRSDLEGGAARQFMGFPVVFNESMNSTSGTDASKIKFLFGDLGAAATFGIRRGLSVSVTTDRYFELDQIGIKGVARWGISVHDLGDNTNAGPVIALKSAA